MCGHAGRKKAQPLTIRSGVAYAGLTPDAVICITALSSEQPICSSVKMRWSLPHKIDLTESSKWPPLRGELMASSKLACS
jgi:hypothetical protein